MRRIPYVVLLALLLLFPLTIRAAPEGDLGEKLRQVEELTRLLEQAKAAQGGGGLDFKAKGSAILRVYNVADLTVRLANFIAPNLELKPAGAEVDEAQPIFGRADEGDIFFADIDELIDLIYNNVSPEAWESGRALISSSGPNGIVVIGEPTVQAGVAAYLTELRRSVGRTVTIEVRLITAAPGAAPLLDSHAGNLGFTRQEGLAVLELAAGDADYHIARSARITGYNGQRISFYRGAQRAFLQDWDVEVAQEASISDPIIGIAQSGLAFDVWPTVRNAELIVVELRAELSTWREPLRTAVTPSGPVQAPNLAYTSLSTTLTVPNGGFALAGSGPGAGGGHWYLLLSATAEKIVTGGDR